MGETTMIQWADRTWNPWQGCHPVSPGCACCYMQTAKCRYGQNGHKVVRSSQHTFQAPLSKAWASGGRVFVCSWSDFFVEEADPWRDEAWQIIRLARGLVEGMTFMILTKRPERIAAHLPADWGAGWPNVWLGVTAEDQQRADERVPILLDTPAAVRFVSVEPLAA